MHGRPEAFIIDLDEGKCLFMGSFREATNVFARDYAGGEKHVGLVDGRGSGIKLRNGYPSEPKPAKKRAKSTKSSASGV